MGSAEVLSEAASEVAAELEPASAGALSGAAELLVEPQAARLRAIAAAIRVASSFFMCVPPI